MAPGFPTPFGIEANAHALGRYAALCQDAGIVPIVEPEVLMDGDHTIERCEAVTDDVLETVFDQLFAHRVYLEGIVLKPNMVDRRQEVPATAPRRSRWPRQRCVASSVMCRQRCRASHSFRVARAKPKRRCTSIVMNKLGGLPWALTFSYGRALQDSALQGLGAASRRISRQASRRS